MVRLLLSARRSAPLLALVLAAGCTCESEPPRAHPFVPALEPALEPPPTWPEIPLTGLAPAAPATTVSVERARIRVDNAALVETWPASDLERARGSVPPGSPGWPRVSETLEEPAVDGESIPALLDALERASDAQRAGTGAGAGGVFNLRVAPDVPFRTVQNVLYTAGLASFGPPRLLVAPRDGAPPTGDRMMPWPNSRGSGPSPAEIARLFEAAGDGEPVAPRPPPRAARLVLGAERVEAYLGSALQAPGCATDAAEGTELTLLAEAPVDAFARCLTALRGRVEDPTLTLVVEPDLPFGRLAPVLVLASTSFPRVRTVSREPAP